PAPRVVSEVPVSAQSFTTAATSSVLPGRTAASSGDSRKVASCVYSSSASPLTTWSGPTIACSRSSRSLISGDPREDAADPGGFTFADHDLGKDPVGGRLQLRVDLVGLDLDERLTLPDRLARLLQPPGDDAFLERIGEAWQREFPTRMGWPGPWASGTRRSGSGRVSRSRGGREPGPPRVAGTAPGPSRLG